MTKRKPPSFGGSGKLDLWIVQTWTVHRCQTSRAWESKHLIETTSKIRVKRGWSSDQKTHMVGAIPFWLFFFFGSMSVVFCFQIHSSTLNIHFSESTSCFPDVASKTGDPKWVNLIPQFLQQNPCALTIPQQSPSRHLTWSWHLIWLVVWNIWKIFPLILGF